MNLSPPRKCRYLDPRETDAAITAPLANSINIPFSQLSQRMHELPPRDKQILVAGPADLAQHVCAWLHTVGRQAATADEPPSRVEHAEHGRLWEPNALVACVATGVPIGTALDLGCGTGRDAVFLAACGWRVIAADVLPDALERGRELERHYAREAAPIEWQQCDLERNEIEFGRRFDLIVAVRYVHKPLLERATEWLVPGGSLVCESFTTLHRERHGKPADIRRAFAPGELPQLVEPLAVREYDEAWRGRVHTARLWAQRPQE